MTDRIERGVKIFSELLGPAAAGAMRDVIDHPEGFGAPIADWLKGPLREWASALLDPAQLEREGHFDAQKITAIWTQFLAGERKWHTHLWNVLMFQSWLEAQ